MEKLPGATFVIHAKLLFSISRPGSLLDIASLFRIIEGNHNEVGHAIPPIPSTRGVDQKQIDFLLEG